MQDIRLCFFGDSFVNGTADSTHLGWAGRLCQTLSGRGLEVTYYNLGIRRETTTELALRWQAEAERRLPEGSDNRLILSFGTNDTTIEAGQQRVETAVSIHNARHILTTAQQHYPVLMISPPPIADEAQNGRTQALTTHFSALCQELTIPYLDVFTPLLSSSTWRDEVVAGDGAHPNAKGYAELANLVENWPVWREWWMV
ncbi:MAG: GDSL-type esterase/lipase family protein [Chloroflexota bacterium]